MRIIKTLLCIIDAFVLLLVAFEIGKIYAQKSPETIIEEKVDTRIVHDTITLDKPIYVDRHFVDSVLVAVTDTIKIHDTTYVYLTREQVVWQDSLSVVYASGILPQVDSVKHFVESKIVTIEKSAPVKVRSRWGVGVQVGVGAFGGNLTPYAGLGLSYNILSW